MLGRAGSPARQVCAAQVEVRPHSAKWSRGQVSHRQISSIKSGPQPTVTAQGRIRGRMPTVLPLSAIGRSHLGNPGLVVPLLSGTRYTRGPDPKGEQDGLFPGMPIAQPMSED